MMLAPQLKQWESEGRYLTTVLFQHKVFCKDCGNPAAPPDRTLLLRTASPSPRSPSTRCSKGSLSSLIASLTKSTAEQSREVVSESSREARIELKVLLRQITTE